MNVISKSCYTSPYCNNNSYPSYIWITRFFPFEQISNLFLQIADSVRQSKVVTPQPIFGPSRFFSLFPQSVQFSSQRPNLKKNNIRSNNPKFSYKISNRIQFT